MATRKSGLRSMKGYVDPRSSRCRCVTPHSRTVTIHDSLPLQRSKGGESCSDPLAFLTRSPVILVGRASDLQAEGRGFDYYTG